MKPKTKSSCLVTGGAGFIGRHVAQALIKKGCHVVVLDDLSGGFKENIPEEAVFIRGSITNVELINDMFKQWRFEKVFHLAAYAAENLSHFIKRFNYNNNLIGSINLINASVNYDVRCFVFTSSIAVYGALPPPMREDMLPMPEDSYGISKWAVEQELHICRKMFGLNSLIFRPHNVYGEYQNLGDKYRNVIGIFISQIMRGEPLTIFGDGKQLRAFTHIDDIASPLVEAADNPSVYNQVFNLGSDTPTTVNQVATLVQSAFGVPAQVHHLPERQEVKYAYSSHEKAERLLKVRPTISLKEGINRMVQWAQKTGIRRAQEFADIEIMKNMPPSWDPQNSTLNKESLQS